VLTFFYFSGKAVLWLLFKVLFRLKVHNAAMVPRKGGVIIAANHASYLDPPILCAALERKATYMAMKELFDVPLIGSLVPSYCIPVDREKTRPTTIKEAVRRLRNGEVIVIFPEGGINIADRFLIAKRGIGLIASMSGAPVVPALIAGTQRALPVGAKLPRLSKIEVFFGGALVPGEFEEARDFRERVWRDVMERIKDLKEASSMSLNHLSNILYSNN